MQQISKCIFNEAAESYNKWVQRRSPTLLDDNQVMEHLSCKLKLRKLGFFSLEKKKKPSGSPNCGFPVLEGNPWKDGERLFKEWHG